MNYKFVLKKVALKDLVKNVHPILTLLEKQLERMEHYQREAKNFSHYDVPTVTKDLIVLSHWKDVETALLNQVKTMDVFVAENLEEDDLIRFCLKGLMFKKLSETDKVNLITEVRKYLEKNIKGKEWAKELKALGKTDIIAQLALILDCHRSYVAMIMANSKRKGKDKPKKENILPHFISPDNFSVSISEGKPKINFMGIVYELEDVSYQIYTLNNRVTVTFELPKK